MHIKQGDFYVMVGPPFSGKSYYIENQFNKDFPDQVRFSVINPDQFRRALTGRYSILDGTGSEDIVWACISIAIKGLLFSGNNVILDTCNIRRYQRAKWGNYNPVYIQMDTPLNISLERAKDSDRLNVDRMIRKSYDQFDPVHINEGAMHIVKYE